MDIRNAAYVASSAGNMSRLERWVWTCLYFALGAAVATSLVRLGALLSLRGAFGLAAFIVSFSWVSFWRAFSRSIVRDSGWGARMAIRPVRIQMNRILWLLVRHYVPRSEVAGLSVYSDAASREQRAARLERFNASLEVLREVWPGRYERLMRLAPAIEIAWLPSAAAFVPGVNAIAIHEDFLDRWQPESGVCLLCHELSHMFVVARRVRWSPWAETRMELIANAEMRLWGRRLVAADRVNEQIASELMTITGGSHRRWWWRRDGTRVHGSAWDRSTPAAPAGVI